MGIPSYYKKLCDRIPGLLSKVRKGAQPTHLWIDFNCMVYHCMRRPGARAYEGEDTRLAWENHLIEDVCGYVKKIVRYVEPSEQVFLGIDGVVPMAKMRQQRLRRFKSHWTASEEVRIGKSEGGPRWDSNAITPGTFFMERLGAALRGITVPGLRVVVSTADEPGEGEHKAMAGLRASGARKSHVIYGLDADLIVLALLQDVEEMWLFREAVECGEVVFDGNDEEYRYFNVSALKKHLTAGQDADYLLDYCLAMCFVGNDFLPHGLSVKLKDGGHDILLDVLDETRRQNGAMIQNGAWNMDALRTMIGLFAAEEQGWVVKHCSKKLGQRFSPARGTTPKEVAVDEWNRTPVRLAEELALVDRLWKTQDHKTCVRLKEDWQRVYYDRWLGATTERDVDRICGEYLRGLQWVLDYYTGRPICVEWCFPWFLPPLWSDLLRVAKKSAGIQAPPATTQFVQPQEQLALVLPLQSYWLIRSKQLRRVPSLVPELYPKSFELFTAGHMQMWECEAQIPLFMPARLRSLLTTTNS
jgi:5'-3' exoribonuclease 2